MKSFLQFKSRIMAVLVALLCSAATWAADYTPLQLGDVFVVKNMAFTEAWSFTATQDGVVRIEGATADEYFGSCLEVFDDEALKNRVEQFFYAPAHYEFSVKTGKTYYIRNNNWNGMDIKAKLTMGEAFTFTHATPEAGTLFAITSDSHVQLSFTTSNVGFTDGEISANGNVVKIYNFTDYNDLVAQGIFTYTQEGSSGVVDWNGHICARTDNGIVVSFTSATGHGYFNVINRWFEEGKIAKDDVMTLNMHGVRNAITGELLNGDGELEVSWLFAGAPTTLQDHNLPSPILSWYNPGDPAAVASFTFSRDIKSASAMLEMGQGEGADDLYVEEIDADHITVDGATVYVDLSGVMRTRSTMNLKMNWTSFTFQLYNVVDIDGNPAFSEDLGSASSYSFVTGFSDITAKVSSEITPNTGSTLTAANKVVEIWFNNSSVIEYDGVSFLYYTLEQVEDVDNEGNPVMTEQNVAHEIIVPNADLDITVDDYGTTILCPMPEGIYEAKNVRVALNITKSLDGNDHSIVAYYNNTLSYDLDLLPYVAPANEATVNRMAEIYITLGSTYAINSKAAVTVESKTGEPFTCRGTIVTDGKTNAKIVLDKAITAEGSYVVTIAQGAIGDYIFGESNYKSGITNAEARLFYTVTGLWDGREVVAVPDNNATVSSLSEVALTFFEYDAVAPTWNVEYAPYVEEIVEGSDPIVHEGVFSDKQKAANELVFVLDAAITSSGQYRLVIPAGAVANGANGNPITKEYTFDYTVEASAVPQARPAINPAEGTLDEIANILIDFGQPVTIVEESEENDGWVPQPTLMSIDGGWTLYVGGRLMPTDNPNVLEWINGDGQAVKGCDAVFSIPEGCVMYADGTTNAEYSYNFTITGANAIELNIVATTPEQWSEVDELSEMTITFDQPVTFDEWNSEVTVANGFWTKYGNGTLVATDDPNTLKIVFEEPLTNYGPATITINSYTLKTASGSLYDEAIYIYLTIGEDNGEIGGNDDPVEDENVTITPSATEELASLQYFEVTFGGYNGAWNEEPITLEDAFGNVIATVGAYRMSGEAQDGTSFWEMGKPNTYSITLPEAITAPGFYTLVIPVVCEKPDGNTVNRTFYFMFEVVEGDAIIAATPAGGKAAIYTIDGMRVDNIMRSGVYIVNGKKVMIRK